MPPPKNTQKFCVCNMKYRRGHISPYQVQKFAAHIRDCTILFQYLSQLLYYVMVVPVGSRQLLYYLLASGGGPCGVQTTAELCNDQSWYFLWRPGNC